MEGEAQTTYRQRQLVTTGYNKQFPHSFATPSGHTTVYLCTLEALKMTSNSGTFRYSVYESYIIECCKFVISQINSCNKISMVN